METQIVKYDVTDLAIAEMKSLYMGLTVQGLDDEEGFKVVHEARMVVVHKITDVEKKRVELKADALDYGRRVDSEAKRITALLTPIKTHLQTEEDKVTKEKERIKAEAIQKEKERVERIQRQIEIIKNFRNINPLLPSGDIFELIDRTGGLYSGHDFQEFKDQAVVTFNETLHILNKAHKDREKFEEEQAKQKAEAERLDKQKKEQKAAQAKIDAEVERLAAEQAKIDREKKAEQERKDREAAIEKARVEATADAERVIKENAEWMEREKKEREEAEAREKARLEAIRPDREKLITYAQAIQNVPKPQVKNSQAQSIMDDAARDVRTLVNRITRRSEEL